jgi:hypothetical protein
VLHRFSFGRFSVVAPNKLDCPVPHLTLLFFGAAKDVPEAAKMVTARTARLNATHSNICHKSYSV